MDMVLVDWLRPPRAIVAAALATGMVFLASISGISAQSDAAASAGPGAELSTGPANVHAAPDAEAVCDKPMTPRPEASAVATTCTSQPGSSADQNGRRALILLMLGNAAKGQFGPFK